MLIASSSMARRDGRRRRSLMFLLSLAFYTIAAYAGPERLKVFNVVRYGAVSDAKTDSTKAFLAAWSDGCNWGGKARVYVPRGTFVVDSVIFEGPCNGSMVFLLKGVLRPPRNSVLRDKAKWVCFRHVGPLTIGGGGTLDGMRHNACPRNPSCSLPTVSLSLEFVSHGRVSRIRSLNSHNAHFVIFGSDNINVTNLRLSAPADSHNTDGIKIGMSENVSISDSRIDTGDDCVAIISGSRDITVSRVHCGPGHGISVGSMGQYTDVDTVERVTVKNCTFEGTTTGVRIKTWASPNAGSASRFTYRDLRMIHVLNPIIIDQFYCPSPPCNQKTPSHIEIKDITYENIWGTSASEVAVKLNCSRSFPCTNIVMKNIDLAYSGGGGSAKSACSFAFGKAYGKQNPGSCIH